jgi:putative membrane protein
MPHARHAASESFWASAALLLLAMVYVRGWLGVRRLDGDATEGWRAASFLLGLLSIWAAVASPLAMLDHDLLAAHMVQHLLLMTFAPPLIWLGAPVKALLYGLPKRFVEVVITPLGRSQRVKQLGNVLAHPAVCWFGAAATLVIWHIPALFMLGMESGMWHAIEHGSFLATGLLFWWPVVQSQPTVSRMPGWSIPLYLFFATLPCDILSGFLVFCDRVVYPTYLSSSQPFGLSALQDQQCAGALMWTCVTVVYVIAGTIVAARLLSPHLSTAPQMTRQSMEVL